MLQQLRTNDGTIMADAGTFLIRDGIRNPKDKGRSVREPFRDLKARFAGSRRAEQLSLRSQQRIVATVEDSVHRTEMTVLESLEEDDPKDILFYTPMG